MRFLRILTYILVIVGAINWGLVGMFDFNLVSALFGEMTMITRVVYSLVGISALLSLILGFAEEESSKVCFHVSPEH